MKNLTLTIVQDQLMEMNGNFPNPLPSELLEIRADTWHRELKEVFHNVDEELFLKACSYHLQNNEFYPVLKNIIEGYRYAIENKPKPIMIEEHQPEFTPERKAEMQRISTDYRAKRSNLNENRTQNNHSDADGSSVKFKTWEEARKQCVECQS